MKKAIVTTTINSPTEAIIGFARIATQNDWRFFIVGDKNTPDEDYSRIPSEYAAHTVYLSAEWQQRHFSKLSALIDWNCIQRRSIGFLAAYKWGADVTATVDDDNIPLSGWGRNLVGQTVDVKEYSPQTPVFDPFSVTNYPQYWHRGFPVQLLDQKNFVAGNGLKKRRVLVQADFWQGAPDIDAVCRIANSDPQCDFSISAPFCSDKIAPFNSQNTFLAREVMRDYFMFPKCGRMDDIWAAYYLQGKHPDSVIFAPPSVLQRRNPHNFVKDLEAELTGYEDALEIAKHPGDLQFLIPSRSWEAFEEYQKQIDKINFAP